MEKLLLVDGNALMHRSYHALPPFKTSKGVPTNVLYGFLSILHKTIVDFKPEHVLICFDTPAPTFRNKLLETYQAQRPKIDDDFITQIPFVKEALDKARIVRMEQDGFEADDLIGTIASHYKNNHVQVFILSGDKDLMQLVDSNVLMISPQIGFAKMKIYSPKEVEEKMGVRPQLIPDYKAIAGDPSDNYVGAKGIGPKTAVKLLTQFGTVNNVFNNIDKMPDGKVKTILMQYEKDVKVAHELATIRIDVPLTFDMEKTHFSWFAPELKEYLTGFEMHSMINRIFNRTPKPIAIKDNNEEKPQMSLF